VYFVENIVIKIEKECIINDFSIKSQNCIANANIVFFGFILTNPEFSSDFWEF